MSAEGGSGCEADSNFHQFLLLSAKDDPGILDIMKRKTHKYTDHNIHNEFLQLMALNHLRRIAAMITEAGFLLSKLMKLQMLPIMSKSLFKMGRCAI